MYTANENELLELRKKAVRVRKNIVRMVRAGGQGHGGGALSAADILTALYFKVMRSEPKDPKWAKRDRFVLSAGHKCLALYATLAEKGFFGKEILDTYGQLNCKIPGHPNMHKLPGVETKHRSARTWPRDRRRHGARFQDGRFRLEGVRRHGRRRTG